MYQARRGRHRPLNGPFLDCAGGFAGDRCELSPQPRLRLEHPRREGEAQFSPNVRDVNARLRQLIVSLSGAHGAACRARMALGEGLLPSASWPPATLDRRSQDIRF